MTATTMVIADEDRRQPPAITGLPKPITAKNYRPVDTREADLGQFLFYDPILSGNRNIACATCHHPKFASGDGLSLGVGEGGAGIGAERSFGDAARRSHERVSRNTQTLFNLGAREFTMLFHDGRVAVDELRPNGYATPADDSEWPNGIANIVAALSLFPLVSDVEMAGRAGENEVADALQGSRPDAWDAIAERLRIIPDYVDQFKSAFPEIEHPKDITIAHAANALAAFLSEEWISENSPFDYYIWGETEAMSAAQVRGMRLFYGKANCSTCHAGPFQTDHGFHAIAMPQIGPGRGDGSGEAGSDIGRAEITGRAEDRYRFRTPSLRNVAESAPYGHSGAYRTLEGVVRHHLDPVASFKAYDRAQAVLPDNAHAAKTDFMALNNPAEIARVEAANELAPLSLSDSEVGELVAFLESLTDELSLRGWRGVPKRVPSGLPVGGGTPD